MSEDGLRYEVTGGVARLTIDRPDRRNAIGPAQMEGLRTLVERAKADPEVRVVVVTGSGEKAFCAGGDLTGMTGDGFLAMHEARGKLVELFRALFCLGKPTIARINGHALGGGFGLAMACDIAIAVEDALFGTPEIDIGLFPMMIMPVVFRNVGRKKGLEMILTGRKVPAKEALEAGLLNRVLPRADLDAAIDEMGAVLARKSPAVLKLGRDAYYASCDMTSDQAFEYMTAMISLNTLLEDAGIGIQAFLTKQEPVWKGR